MHRLVAKFCLISLGVLVGTAQGQSAAPAGAPPMWPAGYPSPASWQSPSGNDETSAIAPSRAEQVPPGAAQPNAEPPPDPLPPNWGNYGEPQAVPLRLPPVEYSLVGPPRGWIQPNGGWDYRAIVPDPDGVPEVDLRLTQPIDLARPDGLAPSGVFGAVTLPAGRAMATYGYLQSSMNGNLMGTGGIGTGSILSRYAFAPTRGYDDSQVVTISYGVTDDLTITGSLPFEHNQIDYTQASGAALNTAFTNPGDIRTSFLYVLHRGQRQQWHANLGMSFPVGLYETLGYMPSPTVPNLPYALRTTSGTYDLLPGLTYRGQTDLWSWGVQAQGTVRLGFNTFGYKLGDRAEETGWVARRWGDFFSTSARFDSNIWFNGGGQDNRLNTTLAPTNQINLQAGRRIDLLFCLNYYLPATRVPGQYLTVEGGFPVYQWLDGPQLGVRWMLNAGWTMAW